MRPGRVLIGGVALSVLLLAGAAIAGFLLGRPPAQWLEAGSFIISKDTGEQYVVMRGGDDPQLQRVPNFVSAQLLLQQAELTPFTVRDKYIRTVQLGEDLGIEGAPATLPSAERARRRRLDRVHRRRRRHQGRHPAAADRRGPRRVGVPRLQRRRAVADRHRARGRQRARPRLPLPDAPDATSASTIGNKLAFSATPIEVEEEWLNLFPLREPWRSRPSASKRRRRCPTPTPAPTSRRTGSATCCCPAPAPTTSSVTRRPNG